MTFSTKNLHKIGNFPTRLIKTPMMPKPNAYNASRIMPCSSVASSSFVMQICQKKKRRYSRYLGGGGGCAEIIGKIKLAIICKNNDENARNMGK